MSPFELSYFMFMETLHFVTLHPRILTNSIFYPSDTMKATSWTGILFTLVLLVAFFVVFSKQNHTKSYFELSFAYLFEFSDMDKSALLNSNGRPWQWLVGHIAWTVLVFLIINYYNVELHTRLIAKDFEVVPQSISDLEFPRDYLLTEDRWGMHYANNFEHILSLRYLTPELKGNPKGEKLLTPLQGLFSMARREYSVYMIMKRSNFIIFAQNWPNLRMNLPFVWNMKIDEEPIDVQSLYFWSRRGSYWTPYFHRVVQRLVVLIFINFLVCN